MTANKMALGCLSALVALLGLGVNTADAQCFPGSMFCGEVNVQVGVPAPPVVYVQPAPPPPVVYVQPPPPPQVVYVQPAPPPPRVVYVQPAPQPQRVYVQQAPRQEIYVTPAPVEPRMGLHANLGFMAGNRVSIGGADIALRLRPSPWVAVDLGIGAYGGTDYDGNDRVEVPFTVNGLFFFNPQNALQLYGVLGLGVSYAHVEPSFLGSGFDPFSSEFRDFTYFGGQAGLGLEWRMSPHFALNVDVRGFIRSRVDSTTDVPEFVETNAAGSPTGRTSNTSSGVYSTLGATLYF